MQIIKVNFSQQLKNLVDSNFSMEKFWNSKTLLKNENFIYTEIKLICDHNAIIDGKGKDFDTFTIVPAMVTL